MYHWISSQPLELSLKIYRLAALPALISAASKTIQFARTANLVLNQSIPRLSESRTFTPSPHRGLGSYPTSNGPPGRRPTSRLSQAYQPYPDAAIRRQWRI